MSEVTTIARPYAKAAFDYAVESSDIDNWQSMLFFASQVAQDDTIASMLSGSVAVNTVSEIFTGVCGEQLNDKGLNFIKVLAENQRLAVLPDIFDSFNALKAEYEKVLEVELSSALELDDKQKTNISDALEKRFARKIKLNCNVDESLIAGVVIKAGDVVIDGSVHSKLNRLNDALQA